MDCNDSDFIRCCFCHIIIHDNSLLIEHATNCKKPIDAKLSNKQINRTFNCIVCDKIVNSIKDWKFHCSKDSHLDKCKNKNDYVSYNCDGCKTLYFGNKNEILSHCKTIHNNPCGLPCIFYCMQLVFYTFIFVNGSNWKSWTFCGRCKKYSYSRINCLTNHITKTLKHFKCTTCLIDFICDQDMYNKHLMSCEHFMLEHLRAKTEFKYEPQQIYSLKLPPIIVNRFTIDNGKASCNYCEFQIVPDEKALTVHLTECIFISGLCGKNTTTIKNYFCAVCNVILSDFSQWKFHLISSSHLIKCYDFNDLVSYTCEICSCHCYGNSHYVTEHQDIHPNNSEVKLSSYLSFNYQRINNDIKSKDLYYCEDCETYAEVDNSDHWNKSHKTKLKRMMCQPCRTEFFYIEENNLFKRHFLSSEHIMLKYVTTTNLLKESNPSELSVLNVENNTSLNSRKTLNKIMKPYFNQFVENKDKATCISCNDLIDMIENKLLSHLLVCDQSFTKNKPEINIQYFICLDCSFYSNKYDSWKIHAISHINLDTNGLFSYFCRSCNSLLYGKECDIKLHLRNEHLTNISDMPLETVMMAKQLMRKNNTHKSSVLCFCESCKKSFKETTNPYHFNSDSHALVASDLIELFYCKYCKVEFYSLNTTYEFHKFTVEHIILSSKYKIDVQHFPKPTTLDNHLLKFVTDQKLYKITQSLGFFCFICNFWCLNLDIWKIHINGKKHINSSKNNCTDHRCKICKTLMYGRRNHFFEHYNNRFHSILRQFKSMITTSSIPNKIDLLYQNNNETKHQNNIETDITDHNITTGNDEIIVGKLSPTNNENNSLKKMFGKLCFQSNNQQDCCKPGKSLSNINETQSMSVQKTGDTVLLKLNPIQDSSILEKISTNSQINSLKINTDDISSTSNTHNFINFYKLKMIKLNELLNHNNELSPQIVYYCVTCDFITTVQENWEKHNFSKHSGKTEIRYQTFCNICNLYQAGPSDNLDEHNNTIEHKNMVDFQKLCNSKNIENMKLKTKEKIDKKNNLIPDELLNNAKSSITNKQENFNIEKDTNDANKSRVMVQIKGIQIHYKQNGWVELKKIISKFGFFGLYPKNNSVLILFRKLSSLTQFMKSKEKLEKTHGFTICIIIEEDKLPELQKITEYEFGNQDKLIKTIDTLFISINQEISNSDIYPRLIMLINAVQRSASCFNDGQIYPFGSRMSGLALKESDVDLYFDIAYTFNGSLSNDLGAQEDLVRYFGKLFRSQNKEFKKIQPITGARVPIVKFYHCPSGLNCDLSFKSGLSTHNTKLVRLYLTLDKSVHWTVCAVVKHWALQNDLKNRSGFTSYALAWIVLFYLMTIKVVPPLKFLRDNAVYSNDRNGISDEMFIEDWDCTFCTLEKAKLIWKVPRTAGWELLNGFFKFYSEPNRLKQFVLCPVIGEAIPKENFIDIPMKTPDILGFYKKKTGNATQWCLKLRGNFFGEGLAVQDPFDLFHNITKTIVPRKLQSFSHLCARTLEVMNKGTQPYYA